MLPRLAQSRGHCNQRRQLYVDTTGMKGGGRHFWEREQIPSNSCPFPTVQRTPGTVSKLDGWLQAPIQGWHTPHQGFLPLLPGRALPRKWMLLALVFRAGIPAPKLRCFLLCIKTGVILGARAGNQGLLHQERTKQGPLAPWKQWLFVLTGEEAKDQQLLGFASLINRTSWCWG